MLALSVQALALSLVVGMSVDYIIHLAHAYNNSLFDDRFFNSFIGFCGLSSAAGGSSRGLLRRQDQQLPPRHRELRVVDLR